MDVWNKRQLSRPPDYTIKYTQEERRQNNIDNCAQALLEGILCGHAVLCDKEVFRYFHREVAILTATLFQNGRFRTEKFYRVLKKVEKCSGRWKELNLRAVIENLRRMMPSISPPDKTIRMPSKQMFEYLLIRVLGGYHLLLRVDGYCREACEYLMSKISTGHFFSTAMVFLANVARIRVLALDYCGQLAKLYDDIAPWIQQLKGGSMPGLVNDGSLPQTLTSNLQEYCSSLKVNSKLSKGTGEDIKLASILDIFKEEEGIMPNIFKKEEDSTLNTIKEGGCNTLSFFNEEDGILTKSQFNECSGGTRDLAQGKDLAVTCKQAKTLEEDYKYLPSLIFPEEDIGVSVDVLRKPSKEVSNINKGVQKQKQLSNNSKIPKTGNKVMNMSSEITKILTVRGDKNSTNLKRKGDVDMLESSKKKSKSELNHHCKVHLSSDSKVTHKFVKHYQKVNKNVKKINSSEDLSTFLKEEKKRRCKKDKERISLLLKKEDWVHFTMLIKNRVKKAEKLKNKEFTSNAVLEMEQLMRKTKTKIKFWLLYPQLKGQKPENWKNILNEIKNNKAELVRSR